MIKIFMFAMLLCLCSCNDKENSKQKENDNAAELPQLKVYNMGGAPADSVEAFTSRLKKVYDNTVYAGELDIVDSAHIKNDRKGRERYWNSVLLNHMKKIRKNNDIMLVIVNADICNWTKNGSHANLGMSLLGSRISMVSYRRLKVNHLNTVNNMLKVSIHELGHSVGSLVKERKDLRFHCPDTRCMMLDARNKFPYRKTTGFCSVCDRVMHSHGFKTEFLGL